MPKISVLIPVYNVEKYLESCLESIINQTEKDIEIICVEDASTDNSRKILEEYQQKDARIRIIEHENNAGLCKTRKDGVLAATGEYIMFVDSDDYIECNACKELYDMIQEAKVDVLQYGTILEYGENVSSDMADWVKNFMMPTEEHVEKTDLLKACFVEGKINCNLVNKIWKTTCCKKAYEYIDDGHYVSAEDRYASFLLLFFANSANGTLKQYYHYRLGIGVTGGEQLDLERFEKRCRGAIIINHIRAFLEEVQGVEQYEKEYRAFANDILWDCVDCWYNKLEKEDYAEGYRILLKYWKPWEVVGALGRVYFEKQTELLQRADGNLHKQVAVYYRYIGYSIMDSVIDKYIEEYQRNGYQVFLFTDEDAPEQSDSYRGYNLQHIPSATVSNWDQYVKRSEEWYKYLLEEQITEVCYLSPTSHISDLDRLFIEGANIRCRVCLDEYVVDRYEHQLRLIVDEVNKQNKELLELRNRYNVIIDTKWYHFIMKIKKVLKK